LVGRRPQGVGSRCGEDVGMSKARATSHGTWRARLCRPPGRQRNFMAVVTAHPRAMHSNLATMETDLSLGGIVYLCFTPLLGVSAVVQRFLSSSSAVHPDRAVVCATIDDAPHFSEADKARIVASYAPHEREARTKGVPVLGSGRIFPVKEETLAIEHREFPRHWPRIGGVGFWGGPPFSAGWVGWGVGTPAGHRL